MTPLQKSQAISGLILNLGRDLVRVTMKLIIKLIVNNNNEYRIILIIIREIVIRPFDNSTCFDATFRCEERKSGGGGENARERERDREKESQRARERARGGGGGRGGELWTSKTIRLIRLPPNPLNP